jgi:hypothetical protein
MNASLIDYGHPRGLIALIIVSVSHLSCTSHPFNWYFGSWSGLLGLSNMGNSRILGRSMLAGRPFSQNTSKASMSMTSGMSSIANVPSLPMVPKPPAPAVQTSHKLILAVETWTLVAAPSEAKFFASFPFITDRRPRFVHLSELFNFGTLGNFTLLFETLFTLYQL